MRAYAALAALALFCFAVPACESCLQDCQPNVTRACYLVADASAGVGVCIGGRQTCQSNGVFGPCEAAGAPGVEICDGLDNDCNGLVDDEVSNACGGCSRLDLTPRTACGVCGTHECDGGEVVTCVDPGLNNCGVCGPLVWQVGNPCYNQGNDAGACGHYICDGTGTGAVCELSPDPDGDGYRGSCDNCPDVYNPDQQDSDDNGVGDACEPTG